MKKIKNLLPVAILAIAFVCAPIAKAAFPVKSNTETREKTISSGPLAGSELSAPTKVSESTTPSAPAKESKGLAGKSQLVALLLCLLVGGLGVHRFYLGYTGIGIIQLLTAGGCGIWTLIDLVRIITGDLEPKDGGYDSTL